MDRIIGGGIKGDMKKVLEKELGEKGIVGFDIRKYPSVLDYIVQQFMKIVTNYTISKKEGGLHICLYTKNHGSIENFVKPGEVYEITSIESFEKGEVVLSIRDDVMRADGKWPKIKTKRNKNGKATKS